MYRDSVIGMVRASAVVALATLAGCSTVQDMAGIPRTGHQNDGTYVVSENEEQLACRQIRDRLDMLGQRMTQLPENAAREMQSEPATVTAAFGRLFGEPGANLKATQNYQRAQAESDAFNALLIKKQCV